MLGLAVPAWFSPILEVLLYNVERQSHFWMISWLLGNGRTHKVQKVLLVEVTALLLSSPGSAKRQ